MATGNLESRADYSIPSLSPVVDTGAHASVHLNETGQRVLFSTRTVGLVFESKEDGNLFVFARLMKSPGNEQNLQGKDVIILVPLDDLNNISMAMGYAANNKGDDARKFLTMTTRISREELQEGYTIASSEVLSQRSPSLADVNNPIEANSRVVFLRDSKLYQGAVAEINNNNGKPIATVIIGGEEFKIRTSLLARLPEEENPFPLPMNEHIDTPADINGFEYHQDGTDTKSEDELVWLEEE